MRDQSPLYAASTSIRTSSAAPPAEGQLLRVDDGGCRGCVQLWRGAVVCRRQAPPQGIPCAHSGAAPAGALAGSRPPPPGLELQATCCCRLPRWQRAASLPHGDIHRCSGASYFVLHRGASRWPSTKDRDRHGRPMGAERVREDRDIQAWGVKKSAQQQGEDRKPRKANCQAVLQCRTVPAARKPGWTAASTGNRHQCSGQHSTTRGQAQCHF